MASFKKVALAICLTMAMDAMPSQSTDPYAYYSSPTSEKLIDPMYITPSLRSDPPVRQGLTPGTLDPGALIPILAVVSSTLAKKV